MNHVLVSLASPFYVYMYICIYVYIYIYNYYVLKPGRAISLIEDTLDLQIMHRSDALKFSL